MTDLAFMKGLFLLVACCLIVASCAKRSPNSRNLEVSIGALTSMDLQGGAILSMKNLATGTVTLVELTSAPYVVAINDGTWELSLVGFEGPASTGLWSGPVHCWHSPNVVLAAATTDVYLTPIASCSGEPHAALISQKSPRWDIAKWDSNAKWAD